MPRDDIPDIPDKSDTADTGVDATEPTEPAAPAARPRARRLGGVLAAVVLVAAGGGLVSATALTPQGPGSSRSVAAPLAAVPA
ncbi:MAG TPA: hypothetical protein VFO13_09480, partial [Arthrobacter sp.]|nr:hypothetical protein [Arthrobacter sp.]